MKKNNIYIFNCNWERINYGAVLTAYAIQKILLEITEQTPLLVNNPNDLFLKCFKKFNSFDKFKKHYMKFSERINSYQSLLNLNQKANIFITGSDQVFRFPLISKSPYGFEQYLLTFVNQNAKKIAYSASFGVDKTQFLKENPPERIEKYKSALRNFNLISVREKSGVEICEQVLGIKATWLIDPVFLLDKSHYENLATKYPEKYLNKIVTYTFDVNKKKESKILNKICHKYNSQYIELYKSNIEIEEWLTAIKNCKFLITNSFHAVCFAIIFNKPFMCYVNASSGNTRFESLFEMLNMKNHCARELEDLLIDPPSFNIDYYKVNEKIAVEREKSLHFLQKAINLPISKIEERQEARIKFLEETICELEKQTNLKYQIKKDLWNLWLIIFYNYLPEFAKNLTRIIRKIIKSDQ